jgi:NAD(P)-dependent dehydrogenase (short-subunit alcohol dehydrogenase family)
MKDGLEKKLALVTGAGSGIGRATALALAEAGARVVVVDVDDARVDEMAHTLGDKCPLAKRVDVSKKEEMRALAADVHAACGPLDVLVNNAGVGHAGGILDTKLEDWEWVLGVNLWGVIHGCHFFVPKMVERATSGDRVRSPSSVRTRGGHVVNIASAFGLVAPGGVAPYCTTKFAVVGLSESLRSELAPHGIGVTAVCPGMINTDIINRGRFTDAKLQSRNAETFATRGRHPEEVARAILRAIRRDTPVVPVGIEAWSAWIGKRVSPWLTEKVGRRVEERVRNGTRT